MESTRQPKSGTGDPPESSQSIRHSSFVIQNISACLYWIKNFFDYLAGAREEPPPGAAFLSSSLWIGLWCGLMIGLILLFCGQTSKFIYIDF